MKASLGAYKHIAGGRIVIASRITNGNYIMSILIIGASGKADKHIRVACTTKATCTIP
ncbi:hypothetical protein [Spirosoma horti]